MGLKEDSNKIMEDVAEDLNNSTQESGLTDEMNRATKKDTNFPRLTRIFSSLEDIGKKCLENIRKHPRISLGAGAATVLLGAAALTYAGRGDEVYKDVKEGNLVRYVENEGVISNKNRMIVDTGSYEFTFIDSAGEKNLGLERGLLNKGQDIERLEIRAGNRTYRLNREESIDHSKMLVDGHYVRVPREKLSEVFTLSDNAYNSLREGIYNQKNLEASAILDDIIGRLKELSE